MGYYKNLVIEILELHEKGFTTSQIADHLCVAAITVTNVIEQYDLESRGV